MHGMNNFPLQKQQSDYDVGLRDGVDDLEYLRTLRMYVPGLLRKHEPQLVFYQAGVDGMAEDALGRMCLTRAGLSHRNAIVFDACLSHNIPCVVTMGGGYCRPDIGPTVDAVSTLSSKINLRKFLGLGICDYAIPSSNCRENACVFC